MLVMPTYRVYLRWPGSRVSDKTTTDDAAVAELAFAQLQQRSDLDGQDVGIAYTQDGRQLRYIELKDRGRKP